MERNSSAIADSKSGSRERFVFDGGLHNVEGWLQLSFAVNVHGLKLHRIDRGFEAEARFKRNARDRDWQAATNWNFAEQCAGQGDLGDIADAERAQPGFGLWETFD